MKSVVAAAFLAAVPVIVHAQPAADDFARGRDLRLAGRPAEAIALLEAASRAHPADADIWLNLGLAYSATERLADAERALAEADRLAPGYADVQLARARVAYFRGDLGEAERRLAPLQRPGATTEVRELSVQIAAARRTTPTWRLDAQVSNSKLTKGLPDWTRQAVTLSRRLGDGSTLVGEVEHARQFGVDDTFLEAQVVRPRAFLALGGAPNADFRPEWSVRTGLYSTPQGFRRGWTAQFSADAAWARYVSGDVRSLQPTLTLAKGDNLIVARWINTLDEREDYRSGYAVRAVWAAAPRLRLSAGWADAPESSAGVTVKVRAISVGASVDIDESTAINLDGVHEDRSAYNRDELSLGLTRRF